MGLILILVFALLLFEAVWHINGLDHVGAFEFHDETWENDHSQTKLLYQVVHFLIVLQDKFFVVLQLSLLDIVEHLNERLFVELGVLAEGEVEADKEFLISID